MWDIGDIAAELAERYRDAALSGANMRQVTEALETIRDAILIDDSSGLVWDVIDDRIGIASGQPEQPLLTGLRQAFVTRYLAAELARIRTLYDRDRLAGTQAWLVAVARNLGQWRDYIVDGLAAAELQSVPELEDLVALLHAGIPLMRQGRWGETEPLFRRLANEAFIAQPSRARLLAIAGLVQLFHFTGCGRSKELISKALAETPKDPLVLLASGECLLYGRDIAGARKAAERSLAVEPDLAGAYNLLGDCALRLHELAAAEELYHRALTVHPGNGSSHLKLLQLLSEAGDLSRVPDLVARGAVVDPGGHASFLVAAARAHEGRGHMEEALGWYERVTDAHPDFIDGQTGKAYLLLRMGDTDAGRQIFKRLIATAPTAHDGYWGLAFVGEEAEDGAAAERWYRTGAQQAPYWRHRFLARAAQVAWRRRQDGEALQELLSVLADSDYDDQIIEVAESIADELNRSRGLTAAVAFCEQVRTALGGKGDKYEARFHAKLGDLYATGNRFAEAVEHYRRSTGLVQGNVTVWTRLARSMRRLGDWQGSHGLLETVPPEVNADDAFRREIGLLRNDEANELFGKHRFAEAIPLYKEAVQLLPQNAVPLSNLARAWEADSSTPPARRLIKAQEVLTRAVALAPGTAEYAERLERLSWLCDFQADVGPLLGLRPLVTPIAIEVGVDLVPLFESNNGGLTPVASGLITSLREHIEQSYGVRIPSVRVRGNERDLSRGTYLIILNEVPIVLGSVIAAKYLAVARRDRLHDLGIAGESASTPWSREDAAWIAEPDRKAAEAAGLETWTPLECALRHLEAVLEGGLANLLGHQEVYDRLAESESEAAGTLRSSPGMLTPLTRVVRALLAERVPITAFDTICAHFLELMEAGEPAGRIVENLRSLSGVREYLPGNRLGVRLLALDADVEGQLADLLHHDGQQAVLAIPPLHCQQLLSAIRTEVEGRETTLVVQSPELRPFVRALVELEFPELTVLARHELLPRLASQPEGTFSFATRPVP
jgi:tetratricopeptide (TPR) repeat protein